jgi:hypothetical protein
VTISVFLTRATLNQAGGVIFPTVLWDPRITGRKSHTKAGAFYRGQRSCVTYLESETPAEPSLMMPGIIISFFFSK